MTEYFKILSEAELDQLEDAIALITVYIAGADGNIEKDELAWAEKITKIRTYSTPDSLKGFYKEVGVDYHDKVEEYTKLFDKDTATRNDYISNRLSTLNPILAKLDPKLGAELYSSYLSFAKHVAKATGGFLGFFSIGKDEAALLDLKMITPIVYDPEENV